MVSNGSCWDVLSGRALHLRGSLAGSLEQWLHLGRPSDDLRRRHFVRRGGQSRWAPRNAKGSVQPVAATSQQIRRLVLGHAPRRRRSTSSTSGDDRLGSLDAAFAEAASHCRGFWRVQSVVAQCLSRVHTSVVRVGQKRRPRELSGGAREGDPIVALVSCFKSSRWVQGGVGQRGIANGLRGVGVIV